MAGDDYREMGGEERERKKSDEKKKVNSIKP